jgi:hypothetical protein
MFAKLTRPLRNLTFGQKSFHSRRAISCVVSNCVVKMLPTYTNSRFNFPSDYFRRMRQYAQMDVEYASWMMFYLLFDPSRV